MLVTSIVLCIGLISSTCSTVAAMTFSVPDTVTIGQSFTVTWTAAASDPEKFTLITGKDLSDVGKWSDIDRTGRTSGSINIELLDTGTFYVSALSNNSIPIGLSKGILVTATTQPLQTSSNPGSSLSSNTHQQSLLFTGTSTTAESSITSSQPSQNHGSVGSVTDSALVSISDSSQRTGCADFQQPGFTHNKCHPLFHCHERAQSYQLESTAINYVP
ncbi:hypothetical protein C8J56DRAFT_507403 [Mycena floridula]|nr:hypothetical protein C8J56DRAFT_507403 [Mycena floridula]